MLMLQRNLMNSTVLPTPIVSQYPRRHQQKRESAASGPPGVSPDKATGHGSAGIGGNEDQYALSATRFLQWSVGAMAGPDPS